MLAAAESTFTLGPGSIAAIVGVVLTIVGSIVKVAFDTGAIRGMLQTRLEAVEKKADRTETTLSDHAGRLAKIEVVLPKLQGCR